VRCGLTMRDQAATDHRCSGVLGYGAATLEIRTSTGRVSLR
jgi:hypothetical protein